MVRLICPSCGAQLELPDNLELAHCIYCGTKVVLQDHEVGKERQQLRRYKELSQAALQANNHEEAIIYCNKVLEIDPKDVDAWIGKAISFFSLSTRVQNRYEEAMSYLDKAFEVSPEDPRIESVEQEITRKQALWLNYIGVEALNTADKFYGIYDSFGLRNISLDGLAQKAADVARARQNSLPYYIEAMDYFLAASTYAPSDTTILDNIATCANKAEWISWTDLVKQKLRICERIHLRLSALSRLPDLEAQLGSAQEKLSKLKITKGFLSGLRIDAATSRVQELETEIATLREHAAFQPPSAPRRR